MSYPKTFSNIANTFFNYIDLTQYIERGHKNIMIRSGKESAVDEFIQKNAKFIPHPELQENYIRAYGKGNVAKDLRNFDRDNIKFQREIDEARIRKEYVGPKGNTPDVFVESKELGFCGIIDNKAYAKGYSISGDHKGVMEHVYIPEYKKYGETSLPLAFYSYIAGSFKKNIDSQIIDIYKNTRIKGSAMPVDLLIKFAQDYAENQYSHDKFKSVFSVNREVRVADVVAKKEYVYDLSDVNPLGLMVAEEKAKYNCK